MSSPYRRTRGTYRVQRGQADLGRARLQQGPAGIVYHTTESIQIPFGPLENPKLRRISVEVLSFVGSNRSYHFLIHRFGRVFRIVPESDIVHAGHSVWADETNVYVDLNTCLLRNCI